MSVLDAIILGVVQGVTEFLPISSSGHLIISRALLGGDVTYALAFDVMLHVVTLLVICLYFWRTIARLAASCLTMVHGVSFHNPNQLFVMAVLIGTIPAGVIGVVWGDVITETFRHPLVVAGALVMGSTVFWFAERVATQDKQMALGRGVLVGVFQVLALIPGTSRAGITISGGLFAGLTRERAAEFSFILAIPVIAGAGLMQAVNLDAGALRELATPLVVGGVAAAVSGFAAIHFLMQFVRTHTLNVFVVYRLVLAVLIVVGVTAGYIS